MATASAEPSVHEGAIGRGRVLQRKALTAGALVTILLILWAWGRGISGPYHFDDYVTPLNDPASQSLAAWREHLWVTLRPVTKLTYALEAEAGVNDEPAAQRSMSLAFHALSAALLFLLVRHLVPSAGVACAAFLAALWFAHPVHADGVLMLSGRSAVLSGMFLLAALLAAERSKSWLAGLLFIMACFSRETALAGLLPLAVLAASRPGGSWRSGLRELTPSLVGGALIATWILTTPRYLHLAEYSFLGRPFWSSLASQVGAVPVGIGMLLQPASLSIDYGLPLPKYVAQFGFLAGASLYAIAAGGTAYFLRRSPAAATGLALWLAALLPTQSVVPKLDALSNRPLALALAGLLVAAAPCLARLSGANPGGLKRAAAQMRLQLFGAGVAVSLLVLATVSTAARSQMFGSALDLWRDAAAKSTVNARPHLQYALLLLRSGDEVKASYALDDARRIDPFSTQIAVLSRMHPVAEASP